MSKREITEARELSTMTGAQTLAIELDAWWHARGHHTVRHWIEKMRLPAKTRGGEGQHGLYSVRSNLVNGLPPKETG